MRRGMAALALALLAAGAFGAAAQEDAALAEVQAAIADFQGLESYRINADYRQITTISFSGDIGTVNTTETRITGYASGDGDSATELAYLFLSLDAAEGMELTIQQRILEDAVYLRFFCLVTTSRDEAVDDAFFGFIDFGVWFKPPPFSAASLQELPVTEYGGRLFVENFARTRPLPELLLPGYDLNRRLIDVVTPAPAETLDGLDMRVYDLTLNWLGFVTQQPDRWLWQYPDPSAALGELLRSDAQAFIRLWVGADDGYIYQAETRSRIESAFGGPDDEQTVITETETHYRFYDFNSAPVVEPPDESAPAQECP